MKPRVKDLLKSIGVSPSKSRGQNFLIDDLALEQIVMFSRVGPQENVVEIGPGLGALTSRLMGSHSLTVVEIETKFCDVIRTKFPQIEVLNEDIRELDLSQIAQSKGSRLVVLGNLPYAFSTEIIFTLIAHSAAIDRSILLLQREFVERLAAPPGSRTYGALSVGCQLWCTVRLGPIINGEYFHPPTKVESRLVELKFSPQPRFPINDVITFHRLVAAAFYRRRKKLTNSVVASGAFSSASLAKALDETQIDGNLRAEMISVEQFAILSNELSKEIKL